jgi:homoaconitase/3-isopropylmalate dehydratase large subunit
MNQLLSQLSKILLKINQITGHKLTTPAELTEYKELAQKIQQDKAKLATILDHAEQSLSNDVDVIIKLIVNINREFGDIVQEMQNIESQLILIAQRYAKLKNITDD